MLCNILREFGSTLIFEEKSDSLNNIDQYNVVKNALDLEVAVRDSSNELKRLSNETFRSQPSPPTLRIVDRTYPPVQTSVKYRWYILLLPVWLLMAAPLISMIVGTSSFAILFTTIAGASVPIWIPGYLIVQYFRKKKERENALNSRKYRKIVEECDKTYDYQQQQFNQQYAYELNYYNTYTLPQYNNEKRLWQDQQNAKLAKTKTVLASSRNQLDTLYRTSRLIPSHYRNINALEHICSTLSSSDYDISFAINVYNSHRTKLVLDESNRLKEQLHMQEQLNNQLLSEHNDRLDETNQLIKAIRNDQRIIGAVNTFQNARSNSFLKGIRDQ